MAEVRFLPPAAKFIKKIKDGKLKKLYQQAIVEICLNPMVGEEKSGDLTGIRGYDIYYNRTNYELAYTVEYRQNEDNGETEIVVVVLAGTRENFYEQLKRYWNG